MSKKFYNLNPNIYQALDNKKDYALQNHNLNQRDFTHKLKKASSGWHDSLLFDESFLENKNFESYLKQTQKANITAVLQITTSSLDLYKQKLKEIVKNHLFLNFHFIFQERDSIPFDKLSNLSDKVHLVYIVTKQNRKIFLKDKLCKQWLDKSWLYFPYKNSFWDPFLTVKQVYQYIQNEEKILPYPVEIYDDRIPEDMDLEPLFAPFVENNLPTNTPPIYFSVIIPCWNSEKQVINTLKNLSLQTYPAAEYEILVVDDGSTDNTREQLKLFVKKHPNINIKGISFPRVVEKKKTEPRFRAALARNLGVKHSTGKFLVFLDSDILVPNNYLNSLQKEHKKAEVIFVKRYHLKAGYSLESLFIKTPIGAYIEDNKYWGDFYQKGFDKVSCPWKYVCTYGLSLSKKDFELVGAFAKNFIFYGFEDTDLAYRLFKEKKKFLLSDIVVYHQAPTGKNQNCFLNHLLRQKQLLKTAKIFFYRHLEPEIYRELSIYMYQERSWSYFFLKLF